jgi:hypothetical protein
MCWRSSRPERCCSSSSSFAIVVLAYRDRRPGFSYFACGMTTPEVDQISSVLKGARRIIRRRPLAQQQKGGPKAAIWLAPIDDPYTAQ